MAKIYEQINKYNWCRNTLAQDKNGNQVGVTDKRAEKFCLNGWMYRLYREAPFKETIERESAVRKAIAKQLKLPEGEAMSIPRYNDDPNTTIEMVQELCKELDI